MTVTKTFFKSMANIGSEDSPTLGTSTYMPEYKNKFTCQYLTDILHTDIIIPNTYHGSMKTRLCVSAPDKEFNGSYRPEGILFETEQQPDYCCPVDLMALMNTESTDSSNYDSEFLEYSKRMIFDNLKDMFELDDRNYVTPERTLAGLNEVRKAAGLKPVSKTFCYNECGFFSPVSIKPVGLVGNSIEIYKLADKYYLPVYRDIKAFVNPNFLQKINQLWERRYQRDRKDPPCSIH